ncbi:MAG: GIY-YIG nuclease family protein [Chitinophagales bacterium]|nr:GIY-YIG nuclease family protein [Chitinophagales bacterium]
MFYLYKITNLIDNKIYIGITNNFNRRMYRHKKECHNEHLKRAIEKYGWENFNKEILKILETKEEVIKEELDTIEYYRNNFFELYNISGGGEGTVYLKMSDETKKKISDFNKVFANTDKERKDRSNRIKGNKNPNFGIPMTDERKNLLLKSHLGKPLSEETKLKMSESLKGKFSGSKNPMSKLKEFQVLEIREKFALGQYSKSELSKIYNVSNSAIDLIINRKTWKNI